MNADKSPIFTKLLMPMATNQEIEDFCRVIARNEYVPRMDTAVFVLGLLRRLQIAENIENASAEAKQTSQFLLV